MKPALVILVVTLSGAPLMLSTAWGDRGEVVEQPLALVGLGPEAPAMRRGCQTQLLIEYKQREHRFPQEPVFLRVLAHFIRYSAFVFWISMKSLKRDF